MKHLFLICILIAGYTALNGQTAVSSYNFIEYQRSFPRISDALKRKEDTLMKQFRQKKLAWPAKNIYLRSFKFDSQLEVWVKYGRDDKYQLFKTYKVCALAGTLGPKRMQGDYQVPEGFYYINEFNPRSNFHLSLGLNYPNCSDRMLGDSLQPGGDIYIHGKCVTSGCIPIMDNQIEELYILAAHARNHGQDFIPVHIFPVDFKNEKSSAYLTRYTRQFPEYTHLSNELRQAYFYFEKTKKLPIIMIGARGEYIFANPQNTDEQAPPPPPPVVHKRALRFFPEEQLSKQVDKLPVFPGGNTAFQRFIDSLTREASVHLPSDMARTYVMIEFIIDRDGQPAFAKVVQGGTIPMNNLLQERFENMPAWTPATRLEKNVAIKLKQSLVIEK